MGADVQPINGTGNVTPLVAARLCNFVRGEATPLFAHRFWIHSTLKSAIDACPNPWIDVIGYASHLGRKKGYDNVALSARRRDAIIKEILNECPNVNLVKGAAARGDAYRIPLRPPDAEDDDDDWRAVWVYLYGALPPGQVQLPVSKDWFVTNFSASTFSVIVFAGFTSMTGHITFEKPSGEKYTGPIGIVGPSIGLGGVPEKVARAASSQLARRFPVLAQLLFPESGALATDLKWAMSASDGLGKALWASPRLSALLLRLRNVAAKTTGGAGASQESWWSYAKGIVSPNPGRTLLAADFSGPCVCLALSGTLAVLNGGAYVLFFGLDRDWYIKLLPSITNDKLAGTLGGPVFLLQKLEKASKGIAVIGAFSASANIPGLSAGLTLFFGEIT